MDILLHFNNVAGIASIIGAIAAWIALLPSIRPVLRKLGGKIPELTSTESSYLESLAKDLESKNHKNRWSDEFYVALETELQDRPKPYDVPPSFYIVKSINRHLKEQDFNNLSNVEKIDSSRGTTYKSLESALANAQDKSTVIIGPPGSGKTVSLRNLAIKKTQQRLEMKTDKVPIFVNLGYYIGFTDDGSILPFETFLEDFFSQSGYQKFLANRRWEHLLSEAKCVFFLDGIDELPRNPNEHEKRSQNIENFVRAWPNVQFILSCRELDYNRELTFQQILIKPFDRKHVLSYMKKYFQRVLYKTTFRQIEESPNVFELCKNPFYLNLICYFSKFEHNIPRNKTQLFNFIVDQLVDREGQKIQAEAPTFKADFMSAISNLAYFLAIQKMTTTVNMEEYKRVIKKNSKHQTYLSMVDYAIKAELLEYNELSGDIRFIHNRFQEYFSAYYLIQEYKKDHSLLPKNFFTNIWWRETILFIAGLETNADDLIRLVLKKRDQFSHENSLIEKWLKLEMTIVAFECIYSNLDFSNDALYLEIRDDLFEIYHSGTTLDKAKVLTAVRFDPSEQVSTLVSSALDDDSHWVSERAFFILSEGKLKLQMNPKAILKEFGRFFLEGRLFDAFIPLVQTARKSRLLLAFMPIYFLLIGINLFTISMIFFVFFAFFRHAAFRLDYAFTAECLGCLSSISLGTYVILYYLFDSDYPFLKRFLYTSPLALLVYYLVFNIPDNFFVRAALMLVGYFAGYLYWKYLKKPNESDFSLGTITFGLLGYSLLTPLINQSSSIIFLQDLIPNWLINISEWSNTQFLPYILMVFFVANTIALVVLTIKQARLLNKLKKYRSIINNALTALNKQVLELRASGDMHKAYELIINAFIHVFDDLNVLWAQKVLLKDMNRHLNSCLNLSQVEKLELLYLLAAKATNANFKDAIYQLIEEEGNTYRRAIA